MDDLGYAIFMIGGLAVLASIVTIIIPLRRQGFMSKRMDGLCTLIAGASLVFLGQVMSPTVQAMQAEREAAASAQRAADLKDPVKRGKGFQWTALHACERAAKNSAIFPETYQMTSLLQHVQNPVSGSWSVIIAFTAKSRLGLDVPARMGCTLDPDGNFKATLVS